MRVVAAVMLACRAPWRSSGVGPRGAICLARDACVQRDPRVGTRHAVRDVSALLKTLSVRSASTMTGAAWLHAAESRAATASRIVGRHARIDTVFRRAPHIRTQVRVSRAHVNRDERLRICLWGEWKDGTRPVVEALAGETGCCCTVLDGVPRACAERCHGRQHHHRPVGPIERGGGTAGPATEPGCPAVFQRCQCGGRNPRPQDRFQGIGRWVRCRHERPQYQDAHQRRQGVRAVRLCRHAEQHGGAQGCQSGGRAVLCAVRRRAVLARALRPQRLPRACRVQRRNRGDHSTDQGRGPENASP